MKKLAVASGAAFVLLAVVLFAPIVKVHGQAGYSTFWSEWIQNSLIDSTPVGSHTPSTGAFTSLNSSSGALNGTVGAATPNSGIFTSILGAFNGTVGAMTPNAGAFTSLASSSGAINASVGVSTANTGNFTYLNATSLSLNGAAPTGHTLVGNGTSYVDTPAAATSTHAVLNCMSVACAGGSTYSASTTYTNTTNYVLSEMVSIQGYDSSGGCTGPSGLLAGSINGSQVLFTEINNDCNTANISGFTLPVPPGATFSITISMVGSGGTYLLHSWYEMAL